MFDQRITRSNNPFVSHTFTCAHSELLRFIEPFCKCWIYFAGRRVLLHFFCVPTFAGFAPKQYFLHKQKKPHSKEHLLLLHEFWPISSFIIIFTPNSTASLTCELLCALVSKCAPIFELNFAFIALISLAFTLMPLSALVPIRIP